MGEIADMMLDGTMCECCGEFLEGEPAGFPRYCSEQCANDRGATLESGHVEHKPKWPMSTSHKPKVPCPQCGKHVKVVGLSDHIRDKHGDGT